MEESEENIIIQVKQSTSYIIPFVYEQFKDVRLYRL